jgi:putative tryptophan/tyrosine transport system substrate-binding protein
MRRRDIIVLLGGVLTYPLVLQAQQSNRARRIGVLLTNTEGDPDIQIRVKAFRQRLQELGWTEGHNVQVDYRFAVDDVSRMQANATEMVNLAPDVIVASNTQTVEVLHRATRTVPIVFVQVADPVGQGFVATLSRPAGNITGFTNRVEPLHGKWLELLKEIAPRVTRVAVMFNPKTALPHNLPLFQASAPSFSVELTAAPVQGATEIESALTELTREPGGGLIVMQDIFTMVNRELIIAAVNRHLVPAVYPLRPFAASGGLISYGVDQTENFRGAASYVDRILKGEQPANLPVQRPTKVELVINLKTAKALGITIPPSLLARADEVIE